MNSSICYFDEPGKKNTEKTVQLAVRRAEARKIKHIVVASGTGRTGVMVAEKAAKKGISTTVVTYHYGFEKKGEWLMKDSNLRKLQNLNAKVVSTTHALSGLERSITKKLGGPSRVDVIAEALRSLFGQGMKVCVEIAIMAADTGAVPCSDNDEIVAIAGTDEGADTAVVIRPSHANMFFDLEIREIIAMPRKR
ncbi:MAG: hypothetical protein OEV21_01910 [Thermoplasmata archaeon]|nr:hypothetical protein [Thermoplasmata archaeon]